MTEHSVCSMECSDPTSFSYLCQGLGKTCLYTLKFLIKSIIPVMPLCLFFQTFLDAENTASAHAHGQFSQ